MTDLHVLHAAELIKLHARMPDEVYLTESVKRLDWQLGRFLLSGLGGVRLLLLSCSAGPSLHLNHVVGYAGPGSATTSRVSD